MSPASRPAAKRAAPRTRPTDEPRRATKPKRAGTRSSRALTGDALDAAILRFLRPLPNRAVDLAPLAEQLGVDPISVQLAVERLHRRRMVTTPFIEPGRAGGAELTQVGLVWLIGYEGGKPKETPVALQPAAGRVRSEDEAARLPRADVYGVLPKVSRG